MKTFALIIPAYNAEKSIRQLLQRVVALSPAPASIIVVDDGSTDRTLEELSQFPVDILSLPANGGKGTALQHAFRAVKDQSAYDFVVCMDADLQHAPEDINRFLEILEGGTSDIVIGKRVKRFGRMPLSRQFSNRVSSWLISAACGEPISDSQCGFRAFRREVLQELVLDEPNFQIESEFILKSCRKNFKIAFVDIETIYAGNGSHIHHLRDTWEFINLLIREMRRDPLQSTT